jgi:RNA polymerase sigma factor (sigma-70 family)
MTDSGVLVVDLVNADEHGSRVEGLMRAAQDGSEEAFGQLVAELTSTLWHVARATGLSRPDAEDVVQTTWLSLVSHLKTIHTPSGLKSWLVTTTKREAWRVRAAELRQLPADQDWLTTIPDQAAGSEERLVTEQEMRDLRTAFLTLSTRCQELLRIVAFVTRPDYDEVAGKLGMARGSVGPTRGRCLEKLRVALYSEGGPR